MLKTTPFWGNEPLILLSKHSCLQIWPSKNLSYEEKMNAIARLVILMSLAGFLYTSNINMVLVGAATLVGLFVLYKNRKVNEGFTDNNGTKKIKKKEKCADNVTTTNPVTLETVLKKDYYPVTSNNPMGNVLLTDIADNPTRKSAQPSFNPDVSDDIIKSVKQQTQQLNPGINTDKQLYGDLKDNYDLDNSMQRFYTTANTRVENDQGSFAQYLYGDMHSAKEDTPEGAAMRVKDNMRYILI